MVGTCVCPRWVPVYGGCMCVCAWCVHVWVHGACSLLGMISKGLGCLAQNPPLIFIFPFEIVRSESPLGKCSTNDPQGMLQKDPPGCFKRTHPGCSKWPGLLSAKYAGMLQMAPRECFKRTRRDAVKGPSGFPDP